MKPLDLINAPLEGINLIEASAGTGKTYTIEGLFLRLILEKQLQVDQILVVTFTNAATAELRERIRRKLLLAEKAFISGAPEDPMMDTLIERQTERSAAVSMIHDALVEFDRAPIFTIHGFCARILYEHAFETANLFDTELVSDSSEWERDVAEDFWRQHLYDAPPECISYLINQLKGPIAFQRMLGKMGAADINIIPRVRQPDLKALSDFRNAYQKVRDEWPHSQPAVEKALRDPSLNGKWYGGLKTPKNADTVSKRDLTVLSLVAAMEQYVSSGTMGFPLFKTFKKFTAQQIIAAARKGQTPPAHIFFNACDELYRCAAKLNGELQQYLIYLKSHLFATAPAALKKVKSEKNIQFFDDLLLLVHRALMSKEGNPLADSVRQKYHAALVDEFQDTDSVQYDIFSRLFSNPGSLLFMIGDPKQAIYSFRGADLFSYLKAARDAQNKFTLIENWRSDPQLISAVNTMFANLKSPFLFDEIAFTEARVANTGATKTRQDSAPMTVWYLDSRTHSDQDKPITKTEATRLIADAVAEEICQITDAETGSWQAGDIAVLVRTNRQARLVKSCLSTRGIPSVLYSTGDIFDSREAMEVERVLLSISEPDNPGLLKAALAMDMMGARGEDLLSVETDAARWEMLLTRLREYTNLWQRSGFMSMFRSLLSRESVRQRLLAFVDGERRLTNVLHIAEILHRESVNQNLGVRGTLKWLAEQRDPRSPRLEEHQLRLESDAQAIHIVTIHKSKGLEYPVVFCPYGWEGSIIKNADIVFHQPGTTGSRSCLTMDLGSEKYDDNLVYAQNELLAENIRLLYVALTRAKSRCYLAWGRINTAESSALAYLLHADPGNHETVDHVSDLKRQVNAKLDKDRLADLSDLAKKSNGSIEVTPLPESTDRPFSGHPDMAERMSCRIFSGTIDTAWKVSSYSALAARKIEDVDLPDRDALGQIVKHLDKISEDSLDLSQSELNDSIFAFPKGSRAGNFFHDIFEHLDYTTGSGEASAEIIRGYLKTYGFNNLWQSVVSRTVEDVLRVPLIPENEEFTLSAIAFKDRINEMEFYFPLNKIKPSMLQAVFKRHGATPAAKKLKNQMDKLTFNPVKGFIKGYIDLVFYFQDRFYLLDWKSNFLGHTLDSYQRHELEKVMHEHFYVLQYHLYVLALCLHLRLRNPGFRYEIDFGGAFYVFIRGVDHRRNSGYGIYHDRPHIALINSLGKLLIPEFEKFV